MLKWVDSAKCDLYDIQLFMVDKDARAGMRLAVRIAQKAEVLSSQPYLGRVGAIEGTRE